ncbi:protein MAIN-LIKE 1-like [Lathyrus oleraceus]|uniref:protein MAIN-LIKE 1-like n=1 Tax=Pisum sativum TaxID=3888 RepID=UPI0021D10C20|nr:protein MAIN-LIKE 1-like [Pisum sativum]
MVPESPEVPEAPEGPHIDVPMPPRVIEADESGSSQVAEADELMPPQVFRGGPIELSLLSLYSNHTAKHIWNKEDRDPLKIINHAWKITGLPQPTDKWFQAALSLFGMKDLCKTNCVTVNQGMLNAFVERWHTETSSFHITLCEISITLDNVSCLLHLSIGEKLLDHGRISKDETLKLMVDYLGLDLEASMREMEKTIWAHARFEFLKKVALVSGGLSSNWKKLSFV